MSALTKSILVFFGAGLGANARYWLGGWIASKYGTTFPWGTVAVNATGSLLIGLVLGFILESNAPLSYRLFFVIGFLGGYTTFSTFSYETVNLILERSYALASWNIVASCLLSFLGTWLGLVFVRLIIRG